MTKKPWLAVVGLALLAVNAHAGSLDNWSNLKSAVNLDSEVIVEAVGAELSSFQLNGSVLNVYESSMTMRVVSMGENRVLVTQNPLALMITGNNILGTILMGDTDAVVNLKREGVLYVGTVRKRWKRVLTLGLLPGMKDVYVRPDIFKMMRDKKAADKKVVNPKTEREFISCTAPE